MRSVLGSADRNFCLSLRVLHVHKDTGERPSTQLFL